MNANINLECALVGCIPRTVTVTFVSNTVYNKSNVSRDVLCELARVRVSKGMNPLVEQSDFVGWAVPTATVRFALSDVEDQSAIAVRSAHPTTLEYSLERV